MTKRQFGELEYAILRVMKSGERMSVKQVHKILDEQNSYNTIMTVMLRLSEKKLLQRERVGLHYEYWLAAPQEKIPTFFEQLKQKIFGVKTRELISYLVESDQEISEEEFAEIEKLIAKTKAERAMCTPSSRISVSRERSDVGFCDEGIAKEKNAADGLLVGDRKLIEEGNIGSKRSRRDS